MLRGERAWSAKLSWDPNSEDSSGQAQALSTSPSHYQWLNGLDKPFLSLLFLPSVLPPSLSFNFSSRDIGDTNTNISFSKVTVNVAWLRQLIFSSLCKHFCHLCRGPGLAGCSMRVHRSNFLREPLASYRGPFSVFRSHFT